MFEFITKEEDRGQVGIGTLIVFIAMVLVAAIAAGVLINTAGLLQTQAEDTGQDSTDQVSNNINIIGTVGEVSTYDSVNKVDQIKLTVQKSAGAGDVDLSGLSIQYVGPNSFANIVHTTEVTSGSQDPGVPTYGIEAVTADTEGDTVMTQKGDRYQVVIPLKGDGSSTEVTLDDPDSSYPIANYNTDLSNLVKSDEVELTITTDSGSQRYVNLQVPDSLVGDSGGTVQL